MSLYCVRSGATMQSSCASRTRILAAANSSPSGSVVAGGLRIVLPGVVHMSSLTERLAPKVRPAVQGYDRYTRSRTKGSGWITGNVQLHRVARRDWIWCQVVPPSRLRHTDAVAAGQPVAAA